MTIVGRALDTELVVEEDRDRVRPSSSEVERLLASPQRSRELLGWSPTVSLEEGISTTIDWIRGQAEQFRSQHFVV